MNKNDKNSLERLSVPYFFKVSMKSKTIHKKVISCISFTILIIRSFTSSHITAPFLSTNVLLKKYCRMFVLICKEKILLLYVLDEVIIENFSKLPRKNNNNKNNALTLLERIIHRWKIL